MAKKAPVVGGELELVRLRSLEIATKPRKAIIGCVAEIKAYHIEK